MRVQVDWIRVDAERALDLLVHPTASRIMHLLGQQASKQASKQGSGYIYGSVVVSWSVRCYDRGSNGMTISSVGSLVSPSADVT